VEEEKKAKKKAKKAQQKQEEQKKGTNEPPSNDGYHSLLVAAAATSTNEDKGLDLAPQKDDDPDGTKLLTSPEPLERAWKLLSPLVRLSISSIDLWVTVYDVAVRRGGLNGPAYFFNLSYHYPGKYLQAIRALNRAKDLGADHPELHVRLVHFRKQRLWSPRSIEPY
jgi:peptide alpha-N-acetyltransferase